MLPCLGPCHKNVARATRPLRLATRRPELRRAKLGERPYLLARTICSHSVRRVAARHRRVACATQHDFQWNPRRTSLRFLFRITWPFCPQFSLL